VPPSERLIDDLADAILDGSPIDWAAAESSSDETARLLVRQLRVLAAVADLHRSTAPNPSTLTQIPPSRVERQAADAPVMWSHLRLVERIGYGAFGEVYRAWDTRLDREVALKLLPADRSRGNRAASSIIHEGRLLAKVRHPNVVIIYGAEQIGDEIGLWMELVGGHTLVRAVPQRDWPSRRSPGGEPARDRARSAVALEQCRVRYAAVLGATFRRSDRPVPQDA
jgi:hypothetical protein